MIINIILFIIGSILFFFSILIYEEEEEAISVILDSKWKKLRRQLIEGRFSYLAMRDLYFINFSRVLGKILNNSSTNSVIGASIMVNIISYLAYRLYWVTIIRDRYSYLEMLLHYVFRIPIIIIGIYLMYSIFSKSKSKREYSLKILEGLSYSSITGSIFIFVGSLISYFSFNSMVSKFGITLGFQIVTCVIFSVVILPYIYGFYKKISITPKLSKAIYLSFFGFLYIFHLIIGIYYINRDFASFIFGKEMGIQYVEEVHLLNQIFASTMTPLILSIALLIINLFILTNKPLINIFTRLIYTIERHKVYNQKKIILILSIICFSFSIPFLKKIVALIKIGL